MKLKTNEINKILNLSDEESLEKYYTYSGWGSGKVTTKKEIAAMLKDCKKYTEETGIQHYLVYIEHCGGYGWYLYADKELDMYKEINKLKNYVADIIDPEIKRLEELQDKKQEIEKKIKDLEIELSKASAKKNNLSLKYYTVNQNNSGGYYITNNDVDKFVCVQAPNVEIAKDIFKRILEPYREFCPCCGERWDDDCLYEKDGCDVPNIYGQCYKDFKDNFWADGKIIIYYLDGNKEIYALSQNF